MKDAFLCHASADKKDYVLPLAKELNQQGISYWLDEAEIKWGEKIFTSINNGLKESRFVIVFLSANFIGREWPQSELAAALNRENSEGRTVVLPLITGDADEILSRYPLLRDKSYVKWSEGTTNIVEKIKPLIFVAKPRKKISVAIRNTFHTTLVDPNSVVDLLSQLHSHTTYKSEYIVEELKKCGFLAVELPDSRAIDINGHLLRLSKPEFGTDGVDPFSLGWTISELLLKKAPSIISIGRGFAYRELQEQLRNNLEEYQPAFPG